MTEPSDEALMSDVAGGDRSALTILVERHRTRVMAIAYSVLRNRSDAEDVVQEAFVRVWTRAAEWRPHDGSRFVAWLARVTMNLAIDRTRRKPGVPLDDAPPLPAYGVASDEVVAGREIAERIRAALDVLPERQRLAFTLCQIDRLSNAEAASAMNVSVGALELLLVRARKTVRRELADLRKDMP